MAQNQTLDALQRRRKHAQSQELESNISKGIHSKNNKCNILSRRLLKNLETTPTNVNQFGHFRCQEALHAPCSALILMQQHSLEAYIIFIDLVIAFNIINHSLFLLIFATDGIPEAMISVIEKLYLNCFMQLKLRGKICKADYEAGVQQGNNIALILFLYIMHAAIESLHPKLACNIPNTKNFPTQKNATKQLYERLNLQHNLKCNRKKIKLLLSQQPALC